MATQATVAEGNPSLSEHDIKKCHYKYYNISPLFSPWGICELQVSQKDGVCKKGTDKGGGGL